jgi:molybdopterin molybdotransferase
LVEKRIPIAVSDAVQKVMDFAIRGKVEFVALENSFGRFLAKDLIADHDVPSFDRSPYDGFAVRSEDTAQITRMNPGVFEVIGEIGAGSVFHTIVGRNQAVRIMTGAQLPEGADAVVMLELTKEIAAEEGKRF